MDCFARMLARGMGREVDQVLPVLNRAANGSHDAFDQMRDLGFITTAQLAACGARVDHAGMLLLDTTVNCDRATVALCRVIWSSFGG